MSLPESIPGDVRYIDRPEALETLVADIADRPWVALDTEFIRERTYYPRLCLVQVAAPGVLACLDPLALPTLDPLRKLLSNPAQTKVFHAAHQDLEILHHAHGELPAPIFDVQTAAPLLGHPAQAGYARLVEDLLGVRLDKAHTRTDWSRRPLGAGQLAYAADDVRYLGQLYEQLTADLESRGRLSWLTEDFEAATNLARFDNDPRSAWQRIRGAQRLPDQALAVLRELAAWREAAAQRADRPRGWLVRDDVLLELARQMPHRLGDLQRLSELPQPFLRRHGEALLKAVAAGREAWPPARPARREGPLDSAERELHDRLMDTVSRRAGELGLDPVALASRGDVTDLLRGREDARLLSGWRRHAVGSRLLEQLAATRSGTNKGA